MEYVRRGSGATKFGTKDSPTLPGWQHETGKTRRGKLLIWKGWNRRDPRIGNEVELNGAAANGLRREYSCRIRYGRYRAVKVTGKLRGSKATWTIWGVPSRLLPVPSALAGGNTKTRCTDRVHQRVLQLVASPLLARRANKHG